MDSGILKLTELNKKEKTIDRLGGQFPRGAYLTAATIKALKDGISSGDIQKRIERYNEKYKNTVKKYEDAEVSAAETEVAKNVEEAKVAKVATEKASVTKTAQEATPVVKIDKNEAIAKVAKLNIIVQKMAGNFGTLGQNYAVNVLPNCSPRPLMIPKKNYEILYSLEKIDLTKPVVEEKKEVKQQEVAQEEKTKETANWKQLFSEAMKQSESNETVKTEVVEVAHNEEETEVVINNEVTEAELKRRSLIGQTGEELAKIRDLRKNLNEYDSPFGTGLIEREQNLLDILVDAANISEDKNIKPVNLDSVGEETDFQKIINDVVGYVKPLTAEEEKEKEDEMNDYYSDPETLADIDKQLMKDRLYMMNTPEMSKKIDEAEREADRRVAEAAVAKSNEMMEELNLKDAALCQAKELIELEKVYSGAKNQAREFFEHDLAVRGAKAQAEELLEKKRILEGSMKQAEEIIDRYLAVEGAKAQARALYEKQSLYDGAKDQAQQLFDKKIIIDGAKTQAKQIFDQEKRDNDVKALNEELLKGAEEQARLLNEFNEIMRGARRQAAELIEKEAIINGAKAQAKALFELEKKQLQSNTNKQSVDDYIIEGSKVQAKTLVEKNKLLNGARRQAEELNEKSKIIRGSRAQAKALVEKNILLNGARKQAEELNERTLAVRGAKKQAKELMEKRAMLMGAKYQAEELFEKEIVTKGAKKQAKELAEKNNLLNGAKSQAEELFEISSVIRGAREQARNLLNSIKKINKTDDTSSMEELLIKMAHNSVSGDEIIQGAKEQAENLFAMFNKKNNANKSLQSFNCELTEINDRYGDVVGMSRPIKLNDKQYKTLSMLIENSQNDSTGTSSMMDDMDSMVIPNVEFLKIA